MISGDVHRAIHDLWPQFHKEHAQLSLGNLTKKDLVCQFFKKLDGKPITTVVLGRKTKGRCVPQSQLPVHTHFIFIFIKKKKNKRERE